MKVLLKINLSQEKLRWSSENRLWNGYNRSGYLPVVNDVILVSLLLSLNRFAPCYIVEFEQVNVCWICNDNENDGNDEVVDSTDFTSTWKINKVFTFFKVGPEGQGIESQWRRQRVGGWGLRKTKTHLHRPIKIPYCLTPTRIEKCLA